MIIDLEPLIIYHIYLIMNDSYVTITMKNSIVPLHTEVSWISKDAHLNRLWNLFNSILEFLKEIYVDLKGRFLQFKINVAYMIHLFIKYSAINLQLEGDEFNFITIKPIISNFLKKLI